MKYKRLRSAITKMGFEYPRQWRYDIDEDGKITFYNGLGGLYISKIDFENASQAYSIYLSNLQKQEYKPLYVHFGNNEFIHYKNRYIDDKSRELIHSYWFYHINEYVYVISYAIELERSNSPDAINELK